MMPSLLLRRPFLALPAAALCLALLATPAPAVTLEVGERAPGFTLRDLEGNPFTLEQFRGKTAADDGRISLPAQSPVGQGAHRARRQRTSPRRHDARLLRLP